MIRQGRTQILITASVDDKVPPFLRDTGEGWITAEYGMLPRATQDRNPREAARGKQSGRTLEIQRLIGRALRGVIDRKLIPDKTITLDCDVLIADAGTRCASVTGAFVALMMAFQKLRLKGSLGKNPARDWVAAISIGILAEDESRRFGAVALDLDYPEDSTAWVDMNLVGTRSGRIVEVQGTAEKEPFEEERLLEMLDAGRKGLAQLFAAQKQALAGRVPDAWLG